MASVILARDTFADAQSPTHEDAPCTVLDGEERDEVLRNIASAYRGIESVEFLCGYPTERIAPSGEEDYLFSHCKIFAHDVYWIESYHSDSSGSTSHDIERTVFRGIEGEVTQFWPYYRAMRRVMREVQVFDPPETYMVALGWWPMTTDDPGPLAGELPLSVVELLETEEGFTVGVLPTGSRYRLSFRDGSDTITVDAELGWAITERMMHTEGGSIRISVESFLEVGERWAPGRVSKVVTSPAGDVVGRWDCAAHVFEANELDEGSFSIGNVPGLFDLGSDYEMDTTEAGAPGFRQVTGGGLELLHAQARLFRDDHSRSRIPSWAVGALGLIAGACAYGLVVIGTTARRRRIGER
ncbi:MAG: hypothetical protein GY733_06780 [bacterium]|nr:hypothetical protein [bacterium]